jgi:hypothetical protein
MMKKYNSIFAAKEKTVKEPKLKADKKPKKKVKKQEEPTKKRGRPSNAELAAKAKEKQDAEIAIRKELIERQKAASTAPTVEMFGYTTQEYKSELPEKVKDPNWIPPWPVFLPGQRVEYIVKRKDGKVYKGTIVGIDDIHSAFIRVAWDDGSSQYHAKLALKLIEQKTYKSLLKKGKKTIK